MTMAADQAPLHGVRVLDFTELLPGPFLTQSMVELGATVVKAERPPAGDNARLLAPGMFESINRGKTCALVDMKSAEGRAAALALACQADVIVEGYRPGVMARLGLDYASIRAANPSVVYASLTGYGQEGPQAHLPGHDLNYLAAAGVAALAGPAEGPPHSAPGIPVADLVGSVYALASINAALLARARTGEGQYLDVSITACMRHMLNPRVGDFAHAGIRDLPTMRKKASMKPAYGIFACACGSYLSVGALEDHFWKGLTEQLPMGRFADPAFARFHARDAACEDINRHLQQVFLQQPLSHWLPLLEGANLPVARLALPSELMEPGPLYASYPVPLRGMATDLRATPQRPQLPQAF